MRREDLEHLIRAAGGVTGSRRIVVIGSQAILGQFPQNAPPRTTLSVEADLLPLDAPEKWELVTGSLGELSPFHDTFGYFGDGVSLDTATLPKGWQDRPIRIENSNTNGCRTLPRDTRSPDLEILRGSREGSGILCRRRRRRTCESTDSRRTSGRYCMRRGGAGADDSKNRRGFSGAMSNGVSA